MKQPELTLYHLHPHVTAFSTTRHGGYSTGTYSEFNINVYCGDSDEAVRLNRLALCQRLGVDDNRLLMPHQTHGTRVGVIDRQLLQLPAHERQQLLEDTDALTTNITGLCIGVSTADCIPLLLYDPEHRAACAVHAGWRGTVGRIAQKAVETMTRTYATRPAMLRAVIGPGISLKSFEVGDEVYDAFVSAHFDMAPISQRVGRKWHIDLPVCNQRQLLFCGVPQQSILMRSTCTFLHPDLYFSARRLGLHSGRIFTAICIHPD